MKRITIIITQRGHVDKFINFIEELVASTQDPASIEILVAIDDDDQEFLSAYGSLEQKYMFFSLKFFVVKQSEHFSKDYWNFLAKKAAGRFIIPICCENKILTAHWDQIIWDKMGEAARQFGDDYLLGLTKDNIKRRCEDPIYPNFSCHPVISRQFVSEMGYFFDERYWCWGADQAAALLFRTLSALIDQWRLVSLVDVKIYDYNSMHTTDETDPVKLEQMRQADKGYQKQLRISQEHPCSLQPEDFEIEANKIIQLIKAKENS